MTERHGDDEAVLGFERSVDAQIRVGIKGGLKVAMHGREQTVHHRDVDALTDTAAAAVVERRANSAKSLQRGRGIAYRQAHVERSFETWLTVLRDEFVTGKRLHDGREGRQLGCGAGLTIARDRTHDELVVVLAQTVIVEPQTLHDTRAVVLHHHVVAFHQAFADIDRAGVLEIEFEAAFAAVQRAVDRAVFTA